MIIEDLKKKNAKRSNFHKGSQSHNPSQTNGSTKIHIDSKTAIPKLKNLANKCNGVSDPYGFLTDLRETLGIPDSEGVSKYGVVSIPKEDGSILQASLRITNHQANANTYIDHNANYNYNLSIVVKRKPRRNTFIPNEKVILDEFVYYGTKIQNVDSPLTQIVNGIINFLQNGKYIDTTGVALKNQSVKAKDRVPQNISVDSEGNYISANNWGVDYVSETENKEYKTNRKMKQRIRLYESDLHRMIKESVKQVINEMSLYKGDKKWDETTPWGDKEGFKWSYSGDRIDKYIWGLIKRAQSKGAIGPNNLPTYDFVDQEVRNSFEYAEYICDDAIGNCLGAIIDDDYTIEDLYQAIADVYFENERGYNEASYDHWRDN